MNLARLGALGFASAAALATLVPQAAMAHTVTFTIVGHTAVNDGDPLATVENRPAATHPTVAFRNAGVEQRTLTLKAASGAGLGCKPADGSGSYSDGLRVTIAALETKTLTCDPGGQFGTLYSFTDGGGLHGQFRVSGH